MGDPVLNCDAACNVLDNVTAGVDVSCAPGNWNDSGGVACNAITGGLTNYYGSLGYSPHYFQSLNKCYERDSLYSYVLPDTVCNMNSEIGKQRVCKCQ